MARQFSKTDIPEILNAGTVYRKTATITALPAPAGTIVETDEGPTELQEDGVIATDGKGVWPVAGSFMAQNYAPIPRVDSSPGTHQDMALSLTGD